MKSNNGKIIIASIIVIAFIVAVIFWTMVFVDGEDMFVIGAIISSSVLLLFLNVLLANEFYDIASKKGFTESKYFWYSLLFGILGFMLVVALPDRCTQKND